MRSGVELVKAANEFAQEQRGRSWLNLLSTLAALAALYAGLAFAPHWLFCVPLSLVAGLTLVRMFIIYHDYQHGTILKGSPAAAAVMWSFGLLMLTPPSIWNRSHNHHHKHNAKMLGADIGSYPMMTTAAYAKASRAERFKYGLARHPLTILCGYLTVFLFGMCIRPFFADPKDHWDCALAVLLHVALLVLLALFAPTLLLWGLLVPMFVGSAMGAYLFYAQHNFPAVKLLSREQWSHAAAALHSSSYMPMSPLMRWFTGNIGYHHVHHLNARIPFYRLPEAMAALEELQSPGMTSLAPADIRQCLRLKLWSPEEGRMVGYPAASKA